MAKITLTEEKLKKIIKESTKKIIKEYFSQKTNGNTGFPIYMSDFFESKMDFSDFLRKGGDRVFNIVSDILGEHGKLGNKGIILRILSQFTIVCYPNATWTADDNDYRTGDTDIEDIADWESETRIEDHPIFSERYHFDQNDIDNIANMLIVCLKDIDITSYYQDEMKEYLGAYNAFE